MLSDLNILHVTVTVSIGLLIVALFVRFIASWFQIDERFAFIRFLAHITDPFISPVRRIVPPVGFIDLSFIITLFLLIIMSQLLQQALLSSGW